MEKTNILKRVLAATMLLLVAIPSWCADGDTFTANTVEGVSMTFKVISESEKTCQVGISMDNSEYSYSTSKVAINNTSYSGTLTVPSAVNGYSVVAIGSSAFYYCNITKVSIPETITNIGRYAFYNCDKLNSAIYNSHIFAKLPKSYSGSYTIPVRTIEQIAPDAFYYCSNLTSVTIPSSVTTIGDYAFAECSKLTSINIPEGVMRIGNYVFKDCSSLTSINIPEGVTTIGSYAFAYCSSLTSINIPEGVTSIGQWAFESCRNLSSVSIPESVTSIGMSAFYECTSLPTINGIRYADTYAHIAVDKTQSSYQIREGTRFIGANCFYNCKYLNSIVIPESVISIGENAFSECTNLSSITIPESCLRMGDNGMNLFYNCSKLPVINGIRYAGPFVVEIVDKTQTQYALEEGTRFIGYNAFQGCENMVYARLPKSITMIGQDAFKSCPKLSDIYLEAEEVPYAHYLAIPGKTNINLHVPSISIGKYMASTFWSTFASFLAYEGEINIELIDGNVYDNPAAYLTDNITYSRTFKNTNWQAWYVPFEVELTSDLLSRFSFAKYAGTYVDENSDPSFFITIARLKAGDKLKANTPYFVQAKTASNTAQVISVANTTLKPAQETGFDMYSAEQKVSIRGVYSAKTATAGDCDWYAYGGGSYFKATAGAVLNPYRVYLTITERDDNPYGTSEAPNEIKVKLLGDDGATIIEEVQGAEEIQDAQIYDLSGRRIMKDKLDKGIYIIKGKKVLVK